MYKFRQPKHPPSRGVSDRTAEERNLANFASGVGETEPDTVYRIDQNNVGILKTTNYSIANPPPGQDFFDGTSQEIKVLMLQAMNLVLDQEGRSNQWPLREETSNGNFNGPLRASVAQMYDVSLIEQRNIKGISWAPAPSPLAGYVQYSSELYEQLDSNPATTPLIEFIRVRVPSVRPGDSYKVEFIINKIKLDIAFNKFQPTPNPSPEESLPFRHLTAEQICVLEAASSAHRTPAQHAKEIENKKDQLSVYGMERVKSERATQQAEYAAQQARISELQGSELSEGVTDAIVDSAGSLLQGFRSEEDLERRAKAMETKMEIIASFDDIQSWSSKIAEKMPDFQEQLDEWKSSPPATTDYASDSTTKGGQLVPEVNLKNEGDSIAAIPGAIEKFMNGRDIPDNWKELNLVITFHNYYSGGQLIGLKIQKIKFDHHSPGSFVTVESSDRTEHMFDFPLNVPRTVGYLYKIKDMYDDVDFFSTSTFFSGKSCKKGFKPLPAIGFAMKYTVPSPGIKPRQVAGNEWGTLLSPIKKQADMLFEQLSMSADKAKNAAGQIGGRTTRDPYGPYMKSWDPLPAAQGICNIDKLFKKLVHRFDIVSLLCEYLKCLGLLPLPIGGGFSIKLPKIPEFPIWNAARIYKIVQEVIVQMVAETICTIMKKILDFLTLPNCMADLYDEAYGTLSDLNFPSGDSMAAMASSMTDVGIPQDLMAPMKDVVDDMISTMTCSEVLSLYEGSPSERTISYIKRLVRAHDAVGPNSGQRLSEVLSDRNSVLTFFGRMGFLMGGELTGLLAQCKEIEDALVNSVPGSICYKKKQLQQKLIESHTLPSGEISEVGRLAIDNLEKEIQSTRDSINAFVLAKDGNPLAAPTGPFVDIGNQKAVISELPSAATEGFQAALDILMRQPKDRYYTEIEEYFKNLYTTFDYGTLFDSSSRNPFKDYRFSQAFARLFTYHKINESFKKSEEFQIDLAKVGTDSQQGIVPSEIQCAAMAFLYDLLYLDIELEDTDEEFASSVVNNDTSVSGFHVKLGELDLPIPKPYSIFTKQELQMGGPGRRAARRPDGTRKYPNLAADPRGDVYNDYNPGRVLNLDPLSENYFTWDSFKSWFAMAEVPNAISNAVSNEDLQGIVDQSPPLYPKPPGAWGASEEYSYLWPTKDGGEPEDQSMYLMRRDPYLPNFKAPPVSLPKLGRRKILSPMTVWESRLAVSRGGMTEEDLNPFGIPIPGVSIPDAVPGIGGWHLPGQFFEGIEGAVDGFSAARKGMQWDGNKKQLMLWGGVSGCPGYECSMFMYQVGENHLVTEEYAMELRVSYFKALHEAIARRLPELITAIDSGLNVNQATNKVQEYLPGIRPVFYLGREHIAENWVDADGDRYVDDGEVDNLLSQQNANNGQPVERLSIFREMFEENQKFNWDPNQEIIFFNQRAKTVPQPIT